MNTDASEQLTYYLAELAANDPRQLPSAILEIVQYMIMMTVVNSLCYSIAAMAQEWEETLEERWDLSSKFSMTDRR